MKYNVISILIDSVAWDCVSTRRTKVSVTPFLDSLKKECITASNLYSQGPYTDAATKGLYTGEDCLDNFAYYNKLNSSPSNHFKVFHENGYETYGFYYPYYMIGSGIKKYIDHSIYTSGFAFTSEWGGIFYYYADVIKNRDLTEDEHLLLYHHFKLLFDVWKGFYHDALTNIESTKLITKEIGDFDIEKALETLSNEERLFSNAPKDYIVSFLTQGKNHLLNRLDGVNVDALIHRDRLVELYSRWNNLFKEIERNNIRANWWSNRPSFRRTLIGLGNYLRTRNKNNITFLKNYYRLLHSINALKVDSNRTNWQYLPSARREFDEATNVLTTRNSDKPFYCSLHVLDCHHFINFFSYDLLDRDDIINEEYQLMSDFVSQLGHNFKGDLTYLLSIRYTDYCIKKLCQSLKQNNLWDNTILMVFADHGSSFSYYPLHNAQVNCFDDECYHVPLYLRIPGIDGKEIDSYHNSKDIFPTLYDCLGINVTSKLKGHSMIDSSWQWNDYVMTEYMGPGCPDLLSRRIWFSIRDKRYVVAYKVGIYERFEDGDLCEVYNLQKDPYAFFNISDNIDRGEISYLLKAVERRFNEVKVDTDTFIRKLRNKYSSELQ